MYCPHCDYFTDDEHERECPRCAIRLSVAHLTDPDTYRQPRLTGLRRMRAFLRDPGERQRTARELVAFTPHDLLRLAVVLVASGLLAIGTCLPIIGIHGVGRFSLQQVGNLLGVLRTVATIEGAGLMLVPLLGKAALMAIIVGSVAALLRWRIGISLAASLALIVAFVAIGGYYNLMRQLGPELEERLAATLQQQAADVIHPYPAVVLALLAAALLFQLADTRYLVDLLRAWQQWQRARQPRYSM